VQYLTQTAMQIGSHACRYKTEGLFKPSRSLASHIMLIRWSCKLCKFQCV